MHYSDGVDHGFVTLLLWQFLALICSWKDTSFGSKFHRKRPCERPNVFSDYLTFSQWNLPLLKNNIDHMLQFHFSLLPFSYCVHHSYGYGIVVFQRLITKQFEQPADGASVDEQWIYDTCANSPISQHFLSVSRKTNKKNNPLKACLISYFFSVYLVVAKNLKWSD